jgi:hypothetical protein
MPITALHETVTTIQFTMSSRAYLMAGPMTPHEPVRLSRKGNGTLQSRELSNE